MLKVGDIIHAHGSLSTAMVTKVTARQFKLREKSWRDDDGYTGWEQTRPIEEIGSRWFTTRDEAILASYETHKVRAVRKQAEADSARESKLQFRQEHASVLSNVEG